MGKKIRLQLSRRRTVSPTAPSTVTYDVSTERIIESLYTTSPWPFPSYIKNRVGWHWTAEISWRRAARRCRRRFWACWRPGRASRRPDWRRWRQSADRRASDGRRSPPRRSETRSWWRPGSCRGRCRSRRRWRSRNRKDHDEERSHSEARWPHCSDTRSVHDV